MSHVDAPTPRPTRAAAADALAGSSARRRSLVAVASGVVAAAAASSSLHWELAPLVGWDVLCAVLLVWNWVTIARSDADETAELAVVDDPSAGSTDLLVLFAAVASLAGVALVLLRTSGHSVAPVALAVVSVVLSWALVHTVFALRYARLYYSGTGGGVDFNQKEPPDYLDFAYVAFTVGMTFQISDTNLTTSPIRHTVLRHALLSYLFGSVIVAGAINLIAGAIR